MGKNVIIGGRIHNPEVGNVAVGTNEVLDDTKGKKQNVINTETDAELLRLENEKQDNLSFDNTPTENSTNPITSGGVYASELLIHQAIEMILALIPSAASALNQLADKSFVNSTVATATATFRGTYNVVTDLGLEFDATHEQIAAALLSHIATADNNDYAFVQIPVSATSTDIRVTERYKFNGTAWAYEYDLNNSGFTALQWAAINSGITALLVEKLVALPTAAELALALAGKQATLTFDNAPVAGSNNPVKSGGLYELFAAIDAKMPAGASANNKLVAEDRLAAYVAAIIGALDASFNVTSTDGHINFRITQVNGTITGIEVYTNDIASEIALEAAKNRISANESDLLDLHVQVDALTGQKYVTVTATAGTTSPTQVLPSSGQATDTIYRIGSWDGTQYNPTTYSEYAWNGSAYMFLNAKSVGIDNVPISKSNNFVKSGGIAKYISDLVSMIGISVFDEPIVTRAYHSDGTAFDAPVTCLGQSIDLTDKTGKIIVVFLANEVTAYNVIMSEGAVLSAYQSMTEPLIFTVTSEMTELRCGGYAMNGTQNVFMVDPSQGIIQSNIATCDYAIGDGNNNILLELLNGNIKTKNFDSEEIQKTRFDNKAMIAFGDSITYGINTTRKWVDILAKSIGISTLQNDGVDGYTIKQMITKIDNAQSGFDLVFIFGGTNDFAQGVPMGTMYTNNSGTLILNTDTETFYGRVVVACQKLLGKYPTSEVYFMTPLHRAEFLQQPATDLTPNSAGLYLYEYVKAIKDVTDYFSIKCIDLYATAEMNPNIAAQAAAYFNHDNIWGTGVDHLHPDANGHNQIAKTVKLFINPFVKL